MPKAPLLYSADGVSTLVADDSEEKLRAHLLAAFGALKGLAKGPAGTRFIEDAHQLQMYQDRVAQSIMALVGPEDIERYWQVKLAVSDRPFAKGPEGVQ